MLVTLLDRIGDRNPQLFRELKGRLKPRNVAIAAILSLIAQGFIYLYFLGSLPDLTPDMAHFYEGMTSRYCIGEPPTAEYGYALNNFCTPNALGNIPINWRHWWLDMFTTTSFIGIIILLVAGTYLLIADLAREERRGTLNFVRLSPQSASSILVGKILGVPVLLYGIVALALPLHLKAGLSAGIPLHLILGFYTVLAFSCGCFYSAALLYGLVSSGFGAFQAWLASGAVLLFCLMTTSLILENGHLSYTPLDWLILLQPGVFLSFGIHATFVSNPSFLSPDNLAQVEWFGLSILSHATSAITFMIASYSLMTFGIWQGLKRRFHNPSSLVWSKGQSYVMSASLMIFWLGFVSSINTWETKAQALKANFLFLLAFELILVLGLIVALSPQRQTLQDWSRYRHQNTTEPKRSLLQDLIWGEKSPSTVAIAINIAIMSCLLGIGIFLLPLAEYKAMLFGGIVAQMSILLLYAAVVQLLLLMKTSKRFMWVSIVVAALIFIPVGLVIILSNNISYTQISGIWLFSAFPVIGIEDASKTAIMLSILGEWSAIVLLNLQLQRQLRKAGESATKALLSSRNRRLASGV